MSMINLSAMLAYESSLATTAHNIANVSTPEYRSVRYTFQESPTTQGVEYIQVPMPEQVSSIINTYDQTRTVDFVSGVDIARETANLMIIETGFTANSLATHVVEEVRGDVINMIT